MDQGSSFSSVAAKQTIFPLLNEEPITLNPDTINPCFPTRIKSKWLVNEPKPSTKDAFPPGRTFRNSKFHGKGLSSPKSFADGVNPKETTTKQYSCPNIVDMNNTIFYHGQVGMGNKPRKIIDGFFPHKIRSCVQGNSTSTGVGTKMQNNQRTYSQTMWLGVPKEPEWYQRQSVGDMSSIGKKSKCQRKKIERPKSIVTGNNNGDLFDHFNIRKTYSAWPVRTGSSSPWLERYKINKRSATSYALQSPQNSDQKESNEGTTRSHEYMNLSCAAYIQDAF